MYILFILPLTQHHENLSGILAKNVLVRREELNRNLFNHKLIGFLFSG